MKERREKELMKNMDDISQINSEDISRNENDSQNRETIDLK